MTGPGFGALDRLPDLPLDPVYVACEVCGREECFGHENEMSLDIDE